MLCELPNQQRELLTASDAVQLLELIGKIAPLRDDPRRWRLEFLPILNVILKASASAAFLLKGVGGRKTNGEPLQAMPALLFDSGFKSEIHRQAFLNEFNTAPFGDPLSKAAFHEFSIGRLGTLTCLRSEFVDDTTWDADAHVQKHRRPAETGDCLISLYRGIQTGHVHVLLAFKPNASGQAESTTSLQSAPPVERFSSRDRLVLDTLHRSMNCLYGLLNPNVDLNRAIGLSPQLRKTLDLLLAGQTERKVASTMSLSVHTVHDYVKEVYRHFSVTRRNELVAKWTELMGMLPDRDKA